MRGFQILNDPFLNRGTAFTEAERRQYGLIGLLPPRVKTIDEQAAEMYALYQSKGSLIEKRHFLMEIFNHWPMMSTWERVMSGCLARPTLHTSIVS